MNKSLLLSLFEWFKEQVYVMTLVTLYSFDHNFQQLSALPRSKLRLNIMMTIVFFI